MLSLGTLHGFAVSLRSSSRHKKGNAMGDRSWVSGVGADLDMVYLELQQVCGLGCQGTLSIRASPFSEGFLS